jgi:hypothetical protein
MSHASIEWLAECIQEWKDANKEAGNIVEFINLSSVISLDSFKVKEGGVLAFGFKDSLLNKLKAIMEDIEQKDGSFINW